MERLGVVIIVVTAGEVLVGAVGTYFPSAHIAVVAAEVGVLNQEGSVDGSLLSSLSQISLGISLRNDFPLHVVVLGIGRSVAAIVTHEGILAIVTEVDVAIADAGYLHVVAPFQREVETLLVGNLTCSIETKGFHLVGIAHREFLLLIGSHEAYPCHHFLVEDGDRVRPCGGGSIG